MTTVREHLRAIAYGEQLAHEDELIDLYQEHAVAALALLDAAEPYQRGATRGDACRLVLDPEPVASRNAP